jgi:hypothetical protein
MPHETGRAVVRPSVNERHGGGAARVMMLLCLMVDAPVHAPGAVAPRPRTGDPSVG